jgi:two-component system response regulator AtoC
LIERAVVLTRGDCINVGDLPGNVEADAESFFAANQSGALPTLTEIEKRYIKFILDKTAGKKEKAALILGCNRRTLYRKEREYGFVEPSADDLDDSLSDED